MKIKDKFFKLEKNLSLYRKDGQERGDCMRSWAFSNSSQEYARKVILDELFYYESFPEEWEETEEKLGFKRTELCEMSFEDFVVAVHEYYIISIDYDVREYEPGTGLGGAIPYSDWSLIDRC